MRDTGCVESLTGLSVECENEGVGLDSLEVSSMYVNPRLCGPNCFLVFPLPVVAVFKLGVQNSYLLHPSFRLSPLPSILHPSRPYPVPQEDDYHRVQRLGSLAH